jgi:hypothetical protein
MRAHYVKDLLMGKLYYVSKEISLGGYDRKSHYPQVNEGEDYLYFKIDLLSLFS